MNKAILIGNVGSDPEIKVFNEKKRATFKIATNEHYKDSNGNQCKLTDWHSIIAWDSHATLVEKHVKKGMKVMVMGSIKYSTYEKDSVKTQFTNIVMREIEFLTRPSVDKEEDIDKWLDSTDDEGDDLPF